MPSFTDLVIPYNGRPIGILGATGYGPREENQSLVHVINQWCPESFLHTCDLNPRTSLYPNETFYHDDMLDALAIYPDNMGLIISVHTFGSYNRTGDPGLNATIYHNLVANTMKDRIAQDGKVLTVGYIFTIINMFTALVQAGFVVTSMEVPDDMNTFG